MLRYRCHPVRWETSAALREHPEYEIEQLARSIQAAFQKYPGEKRTQETLYDRGRKSLRMQSFLG
ncbi:MAG: hypothetical protein NTAFB01_03080 [Nitrospira sp.]